MLSPGAVSQARGQRVILASLRSRQNRRAQVAVIVSYSKTRSKRRDHRGCDHEKQEADKSLAEPSGGRRCDRAFRMHYQTQISYEAGARLRLLLAVLGREILAVRALQLFSVTTCQARLRAGY